MRGVLLCAAIGGCRAGADPPSAATIVIAEPESVEGAEPTARGQQLEGLVTLLPNGRTEPVLAESWRWEQAGLRLRIKLRPNVRTHNGVLVTPAIAATALRDAVHEPRNLERYWTLDQIRSVESDGGDVVIELNQPTGALLEDLELQLTFDGAGTGPYREVSSGPNEIVLERFDQYHRGRPAIERVIFRSGMTRRPAWTSLLRGEVDMVTNLGTDATEFLGGDQIELRSFLRRYQYVVAFNVRRPPFMASAVRRALNVAIDRQAIIDEFLAGRGLAATGPLFPQHWAFDATIPRFTYDPTAAAAQLDAGDLPVRTTDTGTQPTRFSFTCLIPEGFIVAERIGLMVQQQLYRIGVDMQFQTSPIEQYVKRVQSGDFEAVFVDLSSGGSFGRVAAFWASARQFGGFNTFGYDNAEVDRLLEALRSTTDESAIRSASRRLQRVFLEDPPALFIAWSERTRAVSRRFEINGPEGRDPLLSLWQWTPRPDAVAPRNRN